MKIGFVEDIEVKVEVNTKKSHVVTVKVPVSGDDIVIEEEGEEMYPVITSISQKVHRKLRKVKEKQSAKGGRDKRSDQSEEDAE